MMRGRLVAVLGMGVPLALCVPGPAFSSPVDHGEGDSDGGTDGQNIFSEIEYSNSVGSSDPPGAVQSITDWEPPACWYEPRTASETQDYVANMLNSYAHMPEEDVGNARSEMAAHYISGDPYENYNLDKEDEGNFYFGVPNPSRLDDSGAFACAGLAEWVEDGEAPEEGPAIAPEVLAEAAYEWLPLPETEISMSPGADVTQTVNLPTWIWQDTGDIGEVSATARLDRLDMEATTVATPSSLTIDPGTEDAVTFPGDGTCEINADGTIGEAYEEGRGDEEPPCGVTYLRATGGGDSYELTATITWSVSWTGTGKPEAQALPGAVLETTHELIVEEVQAIVR
jgi:enoyl reductase